MSRRLAPALALAALVVATCAAGLPNALLYDDHEVILAQPAPRSFADVARLWTEPHFRGLPCYRPVVRTSLLVQKSVHGDWAPGFHAVNAALAAAAGLVAYALLRRRVARLRQRRPLRRRGAPVRRGAADRPEVRRGLEQPRHRPPRDGDVEGAEGARRLLPRRYQ